MKYTGTIEELMAAVECVGSTIQEHKDMGNQQQIKTSEGAILNWYKSTGTLHFQGKADPRDNLQSALMSHLFGSADAPQPAAPKIPPVIVKKTESIVSTDNKKIFVVHGHDFATREQLELIIHKLGLNPFVLANTAGGGLTIIEALEQEIGPGENRARFGIVLLTPDDMGYSKTQGQDAIQPRARQNVVLEMGMLIATLGRTNVAILKKGHIEVPSDAQGILYIPFNDHVRETVPRLVDRLRSAGFDLDPACITLASC